ERWDAETRPQKERPALGEEDQGGSGHSHLYEPPFAGERGDSTESGSRRAEIVLGELLPGINVLQGDLAAQRRGIGDSTGVDVGLRRIGNSVVARVRADGVARSSFRDQPFRHEHTRVVADARASAQRDGSDYDRDGSEESLGSSHRGDRTKSPLR